MELNNGQTQTQNQESTATTEVAEQTSQGLDLDGVSSFRFQGEEFTPDRLAEIYQGFKKYGETSKYVDEDKNYWSNVFVDIDRVLKDPSRAEEFKRVYPERFHAILDRSLKSTQSAQPQAPQSQNGLPKELVEKLSKVDTLEQRLYQADVAAASAQIDAILPPLLKKYELADEERVLARAEQILSSGQKLTNATWERLAREDHERTSKRTDKYYEAKLKEQLKKGQAGQDIGAGGSTPGQAPVKPKTFDQAREAMIAHMRSGQS